MILITGAAGFIGSHVAHALLARGETVLGVDNLNDYYDVSLKNARLSRLEQSNRELLGEVKALRSELAARGIAATPPDATVANAAVPPVAFTPMAFNSATVPAT